MGRWRPRVRWLPLWMLWACGLGGEPPETPGSEPSPRSTPEEVAPDWPAEGAPLRVLEVEVPPGFGVRKIYLDAGHGLTGNEGNVGAFCQKEQEHNLEVARDLGRRLEQTGAFEVRLSRTDHQGPRYQARAAEAAQWGADALISIHSDARQADTAEIHRAPEGFPCRTNEGEHGFSVLFSEEGDRAASRAALAHALAASLERAGFPAYQGDDYDGKYVQDPQQRGAWIDRHPEGQRIFMLRAPQMPTALIETHQALDRQEAQRWEEERTFEAFASAVAVGLLESLSAPEGLQGEAPEQQGEAPAP